MKLGLTWREKLGPKECPYIERWVLNLGRAGSLRLHHWFRSDDERAKHDHPADFVTLVLKGAYTDIQLTDPGRNEGSDAQGSSIAGPGSFERMTVGKLRFRPAEHRHTVSVDQGGCWTLLYFFPDRRDWGFWVPRRLDGKLKFTKSNKYFLEHGHHPCDQP
jgi:hypothetical protein